VVRSIQSPREDRVQPVAKPTHASVMGSTSPLPAPRRGESIAQPAFKGGMGRNERATGWNCPTCLRLRSGDRCCGYRRYTRVLVSIRRNSRDGK
jgi:hypothetical protein